MARIGINIATGSLQQQEMIVGIDLGTTNSLVAFIHPETGKPVALKDVGTASLVPSIVYFDESDSAIVGDMAREKLIQEPDRTIFSAKRLMGKSYKDLQGQSNYFSYKIIDNQEDSLVKVQVGKKFYNPIDLSSFILKELRNRAEHILKTPVTKAVITVPAYFNDAQRQATRDAGRLAGLDVLRIVNEPTAASLAYGMGLGDQVGDRLIAVYDLGGGTFDISILRIAAGIYEVLATNGDTYLGGDDIDRAIIEHWLTRQGKTLSDFSEDRKMLQELRLLAEEAKKRLSSQEAFSEVMGDTVFSLSRVELEALISPLVERTLECCKRAVADAGVAIGDISEVVMVGGSTRVPFIKRSVGGFFGREVMDDLDPDEVVALGAAVQADILSGNNKKNLLLDVTPLSLGIETSGGLMDVLISRNSRIPARTGRQYTTMTDGQSGMRISVFQGERDLVKDNRKLAEFNLTGIPAMPAGLAKVDITFLINADGILTVNARELRSGVAQSIEVRPQYGLTDTEVEKMLMESITHAHSDMAARALAEARSEGEQLLKTTERFLQKNSTFITKEEMLQTAEAMQSLQMALTMEDKDLIQKKSGELNEISAPYAERVMDAAVSQAMKGKKV
jgi:molecular chaperone HscA